MKHWIFVAAFTSVSLGFLSEPALAGQGCCSSHGGVAGCSGSRLLCRDGTRSPTCRCDRSGKHFHVKDGSVNTDDLHQKISDVPGIVNDIWDENRLSEPVVTFGNDGSIPEAMNLEPAVVRLTLKRNAERHRTAFVIEERRST